MPVSEKHLAMYAAYLARRLRPATIKQYLNVVRLLHVECGADNPVKDNWYLKSTLTGIGRVKGSVVNRKTPMTPETLLSIKRTLQLSTAEDCIFWAACLTMFFGLFRKSNLFPGPDGFDPKKQFIRHAFRLRADKALSIKVTWSKTIQFNDREYQVTLPVIHPHPLCPVEAICNAFKITSTLPPTAPAFPLSGRCFDQKLKTAVRDLPGRISSHSFRRGGATHALAAGLPGEIVKILGDWKSSAYLTYLDQMPNQVLDFYRVKFAQALPNND